VEPFVTPARLRDKVISESVLNSASFSQDSVNLLASYFLGLKLWNPYITVGHLPINTEVETSFDLAL
jgi:hypothetical protein